MVLGLARVVLHIHGCFSLKEKRAVVSKVKNRARSRFNASISEVGDLELVNQAELGIAMVGSDQRYINSNLDKLLAYIDDMHLAEVADQEITIEVI